MARTKVPRRGPKLTRMTHNRLLTTDEQRAQVMRFAHIYAMGKWRQRDDEDEEDEDEEEHVLIDWISNPVYYKKMYITRREYEIYNKIGHKWKNSKGSRFGNKNGFASYPYKTMYYRTVKQHKYNN